MDKIDISPAMLSIGFIDVALLRLLCLLLMPQIVSSNVHVGAVAHVSAGNLPFRRAVLKEIVD